MPEVVARASEQGTKKRKKCRKNREEAGGGNKRQNKVEVKGMVSEEVFQNMTVGSYLL